LIKEEEKKTALIYDSPITGNKSQFSYEELRSKVSKFAGALKDQGITKGDRVIIYMPMIPEAVVAMLACARIGAIHLCRSLVALHQMNLQAE
jgi:propionyl-CoA synthetase